MTKYAAFISYSSRYAEWVKTLQANLELCLPRENRKVFLDQTDLGVGRSWVTQLQAGLDEADQLVLVVTPESMASPRVKNEWESLVARERDWERRLQVVMLVDTPLPPFLDPIQFVDFREHDEAKYREGLRRLTAGMAGETVGKVPTEIGIPARPEGTLEPKVRAKLVSWLDPVLARRPYRKCLCAELNLKAGALESHPSAECCASALLVEATGDDDPAKAALRVVKVLQQELGEDEPERVAKLDPIRKQLEALIAEAPERGLLRTYLDKVGRDHQTLVPYFQQGTELELLDRVYVQLELRLERVGELDLDKTVAATASAEGRFVPAYKSRHALSLRAVVEHEAPGSTRRWVVKGDPGSGKTTLLRHLAGTLARESEPQWIPVFESLPRLMREREWLFDRIARKLDRAGHPAKGLPAVLEREAQEGRLLLLLDGLDEVPKEDREDAEGLLRDLSARWPATPLAVTSRPIGYRRPGGEFLELDLLPFDHERRKAFLAKWFGRRTGEPDEARAGRELGALEKDPSLRELAGNPLYLTLMALLLEEGQALHRNRTRLYDQVFELLLEGKYKPGGEPMEAKEATRAVLRHLAEAMTRENLDAEPASKLEARLYRPEADALREPLERVPRWRRSIRPFLEEMAERTGILGEHDGPDADWRFWHRTFREALAAEGLEEKLKAKAGKSAVLKHARQITEEDDLSRWAEPYALLAGRVKDPDDLVRALVKENRALGLRAVATAQGLKDETLAEVLELSEKWQERQEVYERMPELIDDPLRALALADQLRQQTRNGNDLFFLEQAVVAVAEKWPDARRAAEQLQGRFYDHIPPPSEELFRWIETRDDGRVEMWREIPDGEFLMGSPSDEEGRDREGPRHELKIASPFQMAVVPVTVAQYATFDPEHRPYHHGKVPDEKLATHAVEKVTWYQAFTFCRWLSASLPWARGARLPTEEEWEYACRAGAQSRYWNGKASDLERVGWYSSHSSGRTHRVGQKPANPWGLYDLHGNVWEWTLSELTDYSELEGGVDIDPPAVDLATPSGEDRVIRGGSFRNPAEFARAASRNWSNPGNVCDNLGFRVCLPAAPSQETPSRPSSL